MRKIHPWRTSWAAVILLLFLVTTVQSQTLGPGDAAPPFALPGSDGQTHSLDDYEGKTVVLAWFPKAFTGG